jgi:hypothetical protein
LVSSERGWFQCSQCGHGHGLERWQVECGDYVEKTACPECGTGVMKVEWEEKVAVSTQWLVVFGTEGLEVLIHSDPLINEDILSAGAGYKYLSRFNEEIFKCCLRARFNPHRKLEVWLYSCEEEYTESKMIEMWNLNPEGMAELVRGRGTYLFLHSDMEGN